MKFVIHHHKTDPEHYDLMIEVKDYLMTWRFLSENIDRFINGEKINAKKIDDHKKKYLTYEGPISCDRGWVDMFDCGEYEVELMNDNNIRLYLNGKKLIGFLELEKNSNEIFLLHYINNK